MFHGLIIYVLHEKLLIWEIKHYYKNNKNALMNDDRAFLMLT